MMKETGKALDEKENSTTDDLVSGEEERAGDCVADGEEKMDGDGAREGAADERTGAEGTEGAQMVENVPAENKKSKAFNNFFCAVEVYDQESALDILRGKIRGYKQISERFLKWIEEPNFARISKVFVPVYRSSARVGYVWTTSGGGEPVVHFEERNTQKTSCFADGELHCMWNGAESGIEIVQKKESSDLLDGCARPFKKIKKAFLAQVKKEMPVAKAKREISDEKHDVIYIPLLKVVFSFEGVEYVGHVNLINGACQSEYCVTEKLANVAEREMGRVRSIRQALGFATLFLWVFSFLSFYSARNATTHDSYLLGIELAALSLLPFLFLGRCFTYNKKKMIVKAVKTGRLPKVKWPWIFMGLCCALCILAVVLFIMRVL